MGPAVKRDGRPPLFGRQWVGHLRCQAEGGKVCAQYQSGKRTCYALLSSACHCVPRSCKRTHASVFSMSLRTSAHTGVAIRVPAEKPGKSVVLRANSYTLFRVRLKYCFLSCPTAESTDCHVASLLAMTCRSLPRVRACKDALPGKPVTAYVFAQGAACFLLPLRGCGLSRRLAPRNDMLKEDARQRLQGGTAGVLPESVLATADMPPSSAHPSRQTSLQPLTPARLQHVIANQCAHWCGNPHPRRETWQVSST